MHRPLRAVLLALPLLAAALPSASPAAAPGAVPELPDWLAADVENAKLGLEPGELDDTCRKRTFALDQGLPCAQLALRRLTGLDVDVDLAESARLARQACKRENAQGCALLGWMLEEGVGVERNLEEAERAYQDSCRASDPHPHGGGCFRLAARLSTRRADRASVTRALRASCAAQYQPACADAYPNGPDEFPPAPPQYDGAGVSEQRRLCGVGVATACAALGDRASTGDGVALSFRDAAAFYRKACEAKVWGTAGCARLGVLFLEGNGVTRDVLVARRLFDRACKAGVQDACERLGALVGPVDDLAAWCDDDDAACAPKGGSPAIDRLGRACDGGDEAACLRLAWALLEKGPDLDYGRAAAVLGKACDADQASACAVLASLHESGYGVARRDLAASARLYGQACDGGSLGGCVGLAWSLLSGEEGVEKDSARAYEVGLRACEGGAPEGCQAAAYAAHFPDHGTPDLKRAAELLERGCKAKHAGSCGVLALMLAKGEGMPPDRRRALELARAACRSETQGCFILGSLLRASTDDDERREGRDALERACKEGHTLACKRLRRP